MQISKDAVIGIAQKKLIWDWFLQFRDLKCRLRDPFSMKLALPLLTLTPTSGLLHIGKQ